MIKQTQKAKAITKEINAYIDYYMKAKNQRPERVVLTAEQFDALGVDPGFIYSGVALELPGPRKPNPAREYVDLKARVWGSP